MFPKRGGAWMGFKKEENSDKHSRGREKRRLSKAGATEIRDCPQGVHKVICWLN
jgi:hypothetical protein